MSWLAIIALPAAAFALAVVALRLRRSGWTLFGAALLFGLAGYAAQGSPELAASPRAAIAEADGNGEQMVAARRQFYDTERLPSNWIVTADAFARRGDYERAAQFYRVAVEENPDDQEGWLALGMALVAHADSTSTPAATYAFERALTVPPVNGAPQYFVGLSALNAGDLGEALDWWDRSLMAAPEDAAWREAVSFQVRQLEQAIEARRSTTAASRN
ncbi:tetratricopeptide repeat protein [Erythrobacter litoralis]|uniref:tetratricopeptide repeat protein n=1 Tax=Erythrobacter litoralis TaxID=39960 RepID=UPI00243601AF|nr:tetratricopeptide repeat protein [Erythrobacter litoralis]MDG6079958.1 tetratricopeptide repeat protein [Erythrobacter litoralis]